MFEQVDLVRQEKTNPEIRKSEYIYPQTQRIEADYDIISNDAFKN